MPPASCHMHYVCNFKCTTAATFRESCQLVPNVLCAALGGKFGGATVVIAVVIVVADAQESEQRKQRGQGRQVRLGKATVADKVVA